jgi:hypothetical protein
MPETQAQTEQVPSGYTRFTAKDGTIYDLKGEGLSQDEVTSRVQKIRAGQSPQQTKPMTPEKPQGFWDKFEQENAKGMGLDPDKINRMQTDPAGNVHPWKGWLEAGRELTKDAGDWMTRTLKDPAHITDPLHGIASNFVTAAGLPDTGSVFDRNNYSAPNPGKLLGATATILGGADKYEAPKAAAPKVAAPFVEQRGVNDAFRPASTATVPPKVQPQFATETPGTMTDASRLGAKGQGGVVVKQPALLPERSGAAAPMGNAEEGFMSPTHEAPKAPPPKIHINEDMNPLNRKLEGTNATGNPEGVKPQVGAPEIPKGNPTPFTARPTITQETHPFARPALPNRPVAAGQQFDPLSSETPLERSTPENPAWIKNAMNQPELEASHARQQRTINGERMMDTIGQDAEIAKQMRDLTGNAKEGKGSIQVAMKDLLGEHWSVSSSKTAEAGKISRIDALNRLLDHGYTPEQIIKAAWK